MLVKHEGHNTDQARAVSTHGPHNHQQTQPANPTEASASNSNHSPYNRERQSNLVPNTWL